MDYKKLNRLFEASSKSKRYIIETSGMTGASINKILKGESDPKISSLEKIASAIGINVSILFEDDKKNSGNKMKNVQIGDNNSNSQSFNINQTPCKYAEPEKNATETIAELTQEKVILEETIKKLKEEIKMKEEIIETQKEHINTLKTLLPK